MSLDEKVGKLVSMYGNLQHNVLPSFLQDPSPNNLQVRDQIIAQNGQSMVNEPAGVARDQLKVNIASYEQMLKGNIGEPNEIYDLLMHPESAPRNPKALVTEKTYSTYKKDKKLSPEGEKAFYMSMMQNEKLQDELGKLLKTKEPEKFKEYMHEFSLAQAIKTGIAQGKVENVLAFIQQQTGADVASLMQGHLTYGNPENAKIIAMHIAKAAEKRAAALYETTKDDLSKMVETAIQKTGTMGYVEAIIDWNKIYGAEAKVKQEQKAAPQKPALYVVPNEEDEAEQGAA